MANIGGPPAAPKYSICGFDIGSENCYVAVAGGGGIEVLLNDYSQRSTPAYVALGADKQRDLGVSAKQKHLMNIQRTFYALKRIVGRQYNDVISTEKLPFPIEQGERGDVVVRVTHNDEEWTFSATQLLAMLFTKLRQISNNAVDCVINCPHYFNDGQRRAMIDAAHIAGLNPLRLLPDMTAIAFLYGFYRTSSGADSTVAFIDVGQTTTQCNIVHFKNTNKTGNSSMHVLAVESDGSLGGNDFDELLADHFIQEKKLTLNKRARLRLIAECERLKKQMSANSNKMPINVECLYDDRDFTGHSSREEFEQLAASKFNRVLEMFKGLLAKAQDKWYAQKPEEGQKLPDFKLDAVEIVGGGSRIPAIKRMVKDVFGIEPTTTLNADEAVARGCTLMCAMLSPTFKVQRQLDVLDYNVYPINCRYWFDADSDKISNIDNVFAVGSPVPFLRKITLNCSSLPLTVELEYINESGKPAAIGQWKISEAQPLGPLHKNKLVVYVKLDNNGLALVSSATITIENKDAVNGEAETAAPMETDQQNGQSEEKKPKTSIVHLEVSPNWLRGTLDEEELQKQKDIESNLILADKNWKERIDARNELEEYVYEWRNKLEEGGYDPFVEPNVKQQFLGALGEMQSWLYADEETGETQSKSVYLEKINSLKNTFSNDILFRHQEYASRDQFLERLGKSIQMGLKLLESDEKEKVEEKKIEKLQEELKDKRQWYDESHGVLTNTPLHTNPVITTKVIQEKIDQIESATKTIMEDLQRKKREEERKKREEEAAKKKAEEAAAAAAAAAAAPAEGQAGDGTAEQPGSQQPMEVDPQQAPTNTA